MLKFIVIFFNSACLLTPIPERGVQVGKLLRIFNIFSFLAASDIDSETINVML